MPPIIARDKFILLLKLNSKALKMLCGQVCISYSWFSSWQRAQLTSCPTHNQRVCLGCHGQVMGLHACHRPTGDCGCACEGEQVPQQFAKSDKSLSFSYNIINVTLSTPCTGHIEKVYVCMPGGLLDCQAVLFYARI